MIRKRANQRGGDNLITAELRRALTFACEQLEKAKPRTITRTDDLTPIVVFTDGASEDGSNTWGALVHFDEHRRVVAAGTVPERFVDEWKEHKTAIILEVELYPILLIKHRYAEELHDRKVIWFIDNDAARDGLISGSSHSETAQDIIYTYYNCERERPSFSWFARVPSKSNPADAPSRGLVRDTAKRFRADIVDLGFLSIKDLWKRDKRVR